jgi:hypothetical protein
MSESIISQLKEYAMITADDMVVDKTGHEFTEELQAAFERAMEFSKIICPVCWVKNNESSELNTAGKSDSAEIYKCEKCDFEEELDKAN